MFNTTTESKENFKLPKLISEPITVSRGFNDKQKQFEHVVLGSQLKMETFLSAEQSIYALSKSQKKPLRFVISNPANDPVDLAKIYGSIGIQLGESRPDLHCLIYQATISHPNISSNKNTIEIQSVPAVIVYAQDKDGNRKYFLRQFLLETKNNKQIPVGWVANKNFDEISRLDWFKGNQNIEKYMLFDFPLFIVWNTFNSTLGIH